MTNLAWANLWHRKLRSSLAAVGVAIGVAMLVVMLSLSHGTLGEVAQRVKSVQADLIVLPSKSSLIYSAGAMLSDKYVSKLLEVKLGDRPLVRRVIPVFHTVAPQMAGQEQRVFGVDPNDFDAFCGRRHVLRGEVFVEARKFARFVEQLKSEGKSYDPDQVPAEVLARASEMVIDDRLARAGGYHVGDKVEFLGRPFTICAIVEQGLAGRVFVPIQVLRHIQNGGMAWSTLFFIQLNPQVVRLESDDLATGGDKITTAAAAQMLCDATLLRIEPLEKYDQMLFESFRSVYVYINIASAIVLFVSFLFIMVTIYTMVLERRREIGILRSLGAGGRYIMGQTILEALIISMTGTAAGLGLSFLTKWIIERVLPLMTVDIQNRWLILAVAVGMVGGLISAFYPGYRALRADPVECLTYE